MVRWLATAPACRRASMGPDLTSGTPRVGPQFRTPLRYGALRDTADSRLTQLELLRAEVFAAYVK